MDSPIHRLVLSPLRVQALKEYRQPVPARVKTVSITQKGMSRNA